MDSQTHIEFAVKMMQSLGESPSLGVASLFPQIDRKPPTLHRLHAHTLFKARAFTDLGLDQLFGHGRKPFPGLEFEQGRFIEEAPRFRGYLRSLGQGGSLALSAGSPEAAIAAYVSHLYLDTFNQPVQPFAPVSIACAGQWDLWKVLGDFRKRLYTTGAIEDLRTEFMGHPFWAAMPKAGPDVWVEAMVGRLAKLSRAEPVGSGAAEGLAACGFEPSAGLQPIASFLENFERILCELHQKHLEGNSSAESKMASPLAHIQIR